MPKSEKPKASKSSGAKTEVGKKTAVITKTGPSKAAKTKTVKRGKVTLTPEFVVDLKEVFAKHNWSGHPIGFVANPAAANLSLPPCDPGPPTCPDGKEPLQQWVHCPDGTSILRNYCP